jgi:hypothetical protein
LLMTSSSLVDCTTGNSAGLAPLRDAASNATRDRKKPEQGAPDQPAKIAHRERVSADSQSRWYDRCILGASTFK